MKYILKYMLAIIYWALMIPHILFILVLCLIYWKDPDEMGSDKYFGGLITYFKNMTS